MPRRPLKSTTHYVEIVIHSDTRREFDELGVRINGVIPHWSFYKETDKHGDIEYIYTTRVAVPSGSEIDIDTTLELDINEF